jgi:hypothetical protein
MITNIHEAIAAVLALSDEYREQVEVWLEYQDAMTCMGSTDLYPSGVYIYDWDHQVMVFPCWGGCTVRKSYKKGYNVLWFDRRSYADAAIADGESLSGGKIEDLDRHGPAPIPAGLNSWLNEMPTNDRLLAIRKMKIKIPIELGKLAHRKYQPESKNPYFDDTVQCDAWSLGYTQEWKREHGA